ncbi:MAG: hypothetical protein ACR2JB_29995 [Bryobacteraceae bacterium]
MDRRKAIAELALIERDRELSKLTQSALAGLLRCSLVLLDSGEPG